MPLERELAVGCLDVGLGGPQREAQSLVVARVAHVVDLAVALLLLRGRCVCV